MRHLPDPPGLDSFRVRRLEAAQKRQHVALDLAHEEDVLPAEEGGGELVAGGPVDVQEGERVVVCEESVSADASGGFGRDEGGVSVYEGGCGG